MFSFDRGARGTSAASAKPVSTVSSLVELLRHRAQRQPDQAGYIFLHDGEAEESRLTYGQLDLEARSIGAWLQSLGARGERVLLLYPPGLNYIAAFFGCLYAGAVAVPAYPPRLNHSLQRLQAIIEDAQASVVLTTGAIISKVEPLFEHLPALRRMRWLSTEDIAIDLAEAWRDPSADRETLAFLQYTSGSTSTPKGVMVSHGNLLHNERLIQEACEHTEQSTFVGWLPLYHDMGLIGNVLQPLYIGAQCVLMSPTAFLQSPYRWLHAITKYRGATSGGPNFAYDLCTRRITPEQRETLDLSSWSTAFNGAEPIRSETIERFVKTFEPYGFRRRAFYPCYGLAEATLIVSGGAKAAPPVYRTVARAELEFKGRIADAAEGENARTLVGCGKALSGQKIVVANPETRTLCAPGQVGEIWVAGESVAQGYWNRTVETEETFRARLSDTGEAPFLRTGDLGFMQEDGELYVTGRMKDLIIIRGRNYYPQDIELTVEESDRALRPGCGAAFSVEVAGEERLVVVQEVDQRRQADARHLIEKIRAAIAEEHEAQLHALCLLKTGTIPKTSSGKIQRHACRAEFLAGSLETIADWREQQEMASASFDARAARTPSTPEEVEAWLVSLVAAKAGVASVEIDANRSVLHYGLDSLAVIELTHSIESALGVNLPATILLQDTTIDAIASELSALLSSGSTAQQATTSTPAETVTPAATGTTAATAAHTATHAQAATRRAYPLSYGQQALWFLYEMSPQSAAYNIARAARILAPLDASALQRSFRRLHERHAALRTTFSASGGQPVQLVHEEIQEIAFQHVDATDWSETALHERLAEEAQRPFDLERGPLLRVLLLTRSPGEHLLFLSTHHIISDFWSLSILLQELSVLYAAEVSGTEAKLAAPALSYSDYVLRQREMLASERGARLWNYWHEQLAGELPVLNLPTDRPRPPVQTYAGASRGFKLDAELTRALKSFGQQRGATLYMTLLAAYQLLLHHYTQQREVLVGSPTLGRNSAELANVVGYFVNPVLLRSEFDGRESFAETLARVRQNVLDAFAHQEFPFALLVERLQPERDASRPPLMQTMFALQKAHTLNGEALSAFALGETCARLRLGEWVLESFELEHRQAQFDLTMLLAETDEGLAGSLEFNTDLFDAATAERMIEHFQVLLRRIVVRPHVPLAQLSILPEAERHRLLAAWNDTHAAFPVDSPVHELFAAEARRAPDALALSFDEGQLSYAELDRRANQLARYLKARGVGREVTVALLLERSPELVVALLAVLKAGGAFLPIDPAYPRERVGFMLADSGAKVLLVREPPLEFLLSDDAPQIVSLDASRDAIDREDTSDLHCDATTDNLAYVIYTSGSTGRPKGVEVTHRSLLNLVFWHRQTYNVTAQDRATLLAGVAFDASVWELWPYLTAGASVLIPAGEIRTDPARLVHWLAAQNVTLSFLPTPLAENVLAVEEWPEQTTLRALLTGGDTLRTRPRPAHTFALVNHYGPTEYTVVATAGNVAQVHEGGLLPSIGRPIKNTQVYLLDADLQPVATGVAGELCIGGEGLARGYLHRPELTAERFIPDPFGGVAGARLYRTGDLARYRKDGEIEFLGRADQQVKIRGHRIELGEIEAALAAHEAVGEAVVVVREETAGHKRLVAYFVARGEAQLSGAALRAYLHERLPDYMLPSVFVQLERLPLTANGKVDRRALPAPDITASQQDADSAAPRTPVEEMLADICAEVLGVGRMGRDDDFFELGGHSLLATQVVARVRQAFGVELPLRTIFEATTPACLAAVVEAASGSGAMQGALTKPLVRVSREGALPLSFAQQRLWFLDQLEPGSTVYNVPAAVRLKGKLDVRALERSLNEVVRRHEVLRTTFGTRDGQPVQVIWESMRLPLPVSDLSQLDADEREREVNRLARSEAERSFDLSTGPLLRATLLRLSDEEHVALLTMHHIVSDGWSMSVFLREIGALYEAYTARRESPLPDLPIQYADYAMWQREWLQGDVLEAQLSYWRKQLSGAAPVLNLPADRPRPLVQSYRGASEFFTLPENSVAALRALSRREGVTLFMTLLAAFKTLLYRYTNQEDILVGTGIGSRSRIETENLIGIFVNMLVLRTDLSHDPSFRELLRRVRETTLGAYAHQDIPFERLVEELQPERGLSHAPFFQVMLLLQNTPALELDLPGLSLSLSGIETDISKYDLVIELKEEGARLSGRVEYSTDLFEAETIKRLLGHFETLLESIAANPEQSLSELSLLTEAERRLVLSEWNETTVNYPLQGTIHELFEAQAERSPEAVAVVYEGEELTYGELNRRANRLAHYLRKRGVGAESRVCVSVERSPDMVVGLLGILKAGGAYVPSDPSYPKERLAYVLQDAHAELLLTQRRFVDALPAHQAEVVLLDADREAIDAESEDNPASVTTPDNVAYVIYTSGSTGRPKGVLGLHRGAINRFNWMWETYPFAAGEVCCQKTSLGFLDSLWEIFGTMLAGVRTVIIPDEAVKDPHLLVEKLAAGRITRIVLVPSLLRVLLDTFEDLSSRLPDLKYCVTSGEALPFELFARFRQSMPHCVLLNLYGSSEISADCTWYDPREDNAAEDVVPIGKPIANTQIYLLDEHLNPVPTGIYGTLHVGGAGLARGYLERADLTAERFIPDPFGGEPGARLYNMGDLVRWRPDGNLEYGGRTDHQVKIRGFRIELGEVEEALRSHPQVNEAVALAREDVPGEKRLVAYFVGEQGQSPDTNELRDFLREKLPEYMLPSIFMELESLPLTPSGKLNRLALPAPTGLRPTLSAAYQPPQTEVEKELTAIWLELLQLERVGIHDNFFDLGGHSLMATQLMSRVRESFNVEIKLRDFFMTPTVAALAALVEEALLMKVDPARVEELMRMLEGLDEDEAQRMLTPGDKRH